MTRKRTPTLFQEKQLSELVQLLNKRAGKNVDKTIDLLNQKGYEISWSRVTWIGGVGSSKWMPRRSKYRVLVSATKSGYCESSGFYKECAPGVSMWHTTPSKRSGFRYGNCIEI